MIDQIVREHLEQDMLLSQVDLHKVSKRDLLTFLSKNEQRLESASSTLDAVEKELTRRRSGITGIRADMANGRVGTDAETVQAFEARISEIENDCSWIEEQRDKLLLLIDRFNATGDRIEASIR